MQSYIKAWNNILVNCSFDNTYKMAWAKAIVELSLSSRQVTGKYVDFSFQQVAFLCIKYYWNQTIYFDLVQGSNLKKIPEILQYTKSLIEAYFDIKGNRLPERFEKINFEELGLGSRLAQTVKSSTSTLKKDVCYRFPRIAEQEYEIYKLDRINGTITLTSEQVSLLAEYADLLFQIINYRWTQMLESFNMSPRISSKVRAIDEGKIKRGNLAAFRKYLDLEWDDGKRRCFHCGKEIRADLTIDHIIPWSFLFSDDLWNLVYCHQSENSSKSNTRPTEEMIKKLELRNRMLLDKWKISHFKSDKVHDELQLAIERDYVKKFWVASKG